MDRSDGGGEGEEGEEGGEVYQNFNHEGLTLIRL
jgi:hypothetical protein